MNNEPTSPLEPQPAPRQSLEDHPLAPLLPVGNKPALIGYYLGVFGLIPFLGLPLAIAAIVLGIIGLKQHSHTPVPGGKGHAITALVLGIFEVTCFIGFTVAVSIASAS